jgi:hypothetical protein
MGTGTLLLPWRAKRHRPQIPLMGHRYTTWRARLLDDLKAGKNAPAVVYGNKTNAEAELVVHDCFLSPGTQIDRGKPIVIVQCPLNSRLYAIAWQL